MLLNKRTFYSNVALCVNLFGFTASNATATDLLSCLFIASFNKRFSAWKLFTFKHFLISCFRGTVLGLILLNIFINDLFFHVQQTKLNAYADDHQIYRSNVDICNGVGKANQ